MATDKTYVFVHIWDDNANVYANAEAVRDGLADTIADDGVIEYAIERSIRFPGEPTYFDGGMSVLRYLSITGAA